jgi:hypothetical protein
MDHAHLAIPPIVRAVSALQAALCAPTSDLVGTARVLEQLTRRVTPLPGGCIGWTGYITPGGHGRVTYSGTWAPVHRAAYEVFVGPIADGLQIDHLCHSRDVSCRGGNVCLHRRCINPHHLEPVTPRENTLRGRGPSAVASRAASCPQGHPYDEQNTWWEKGRKRHCRACNRDRQRTRRASFMQAGKTTRQAGGAR